MVQFFFMCAMVVVQRAKVLPLINQDVPPMASNKMLTTPRSTTWSAPDWPDQLVQGSL
jgi:hypothetical protein